MLPCPTSWLTKRSTSHLCWLTLPVRLRELKVTKPEDLIEFNTVALPPSLKLALNEVSCGMEFAWTQSPHCNICYISLCHSSEKTECYIRYIARQAGNVPWIGACDKERGPTKQCPHIQQTVLFPQNFLSSCWPEQKQMHLRKRAGTQGSAYNQEPVGDYTHK